MGVLGGSTKKWIGLTVFLLTLVLAVAVAIAPATESAQAAGRGGPCFTAFPDAKSKTRDGVTSYNFQKSVRMVACEEFGRTARFEFTSGVVCGLVSVAAGNAVHKADLFIGGACSGATLATDTSTQARLGAACDFLSALLGVRLPVAGKLAGLACASAPSVGISIEAKHEFNIARDVLRKRKCIRYKRRSLGSPWSAVNCAAGDKGFRSLPRPALPGEGPDPGPDPDPGGVPVGGAGIATGAAHSCAIAAAGRVKCWGRYDALGSIAHQDSAVPIPVAETPGYPGFTAASISSSGGFTCAVSVNPDIRCWGSFAANGPTDQGPDGYLSGSSAPVQSWGFASPIEVSVGGEGNGNDIGHTCVLEAAGTVRCWGNNSNGELGDGTTTSTSFMTEPRSVNGITDATGVASAATYTCALHADGDVSCWGTGGPLGNPSPFEPPHRQLTPAKVAGISNATQISAGQAHICALLGDGTIECLGQNSSGQLGSSDPNYSAVPVQVGGITDATFVSAGSHQTCAVLAGGEVECWGGLGGHSAALGNGSSEGSATPVRVPGIDNAVSVAVSSSYSQHVCALLDDGSAKCWGGGAVGQIGNGQFGASLSPATVVNVPG